MSLGSKVSRRFDLSESYSSRPTFMHSSFFTCHQDKQEQSSSLAAGEGIASKAALKFEKQLLNFGKKLKIVVTDGQILVHRNNLL
jgi:hypothetical protein